MSNMGIHCVQSDGYPRGIPHAEKELNTPSFSRDYKAAETGELPGPVHLGGLCVPVPLVCVCSGGRVLLGEKRAENKRRGPIFLTQW